MGRPFPFTLNLVMGAMWGPRALGEVTAPPGGKVTSSLFKMSPFPLLLDDR